MEALEPKRPGRKGKSEDEKRIIELSKKQSSLEKEVENWKTRYEVAQAYIEITRDSVAAQEREDRKTEHNRRKRERQKQKKKKRRAPAAASEQPGTADNAGERARLAVVDGGAGAGDLEIEPEAVDEEA